MKKRGDRMTKREVSELVNVGLIPSPVSAMTEEARAEVTAEIDRVAVRSEENDDDQLPGQMHIYDYPEVMPQQVMERQGRAEEE